MKIENYLKATMQPIADEPRDNTVEEYSKIATIVKECMPGVKIIEAVLTTKLCDCIDIVVPTNKYYFIHKEHFKKYVERKKSCGFILVVGRAHQHLTDFWICRY